MIGQSEITNSINQRLQREKCLPHFAASLGYDIFYLISNYHSEEANNLLIHFMGFLEKTENQGILENQIDYALRLINYNSTLEYEEIHKLFSLADQIFALKELGLIVNGEYLDDFYSNFKNFLIKKNSVTKLVAEDKVEDWKKNWWWYKI